MRRLQTLALLLLVALMLTACEMHISTVVEADGSGTVSLTASELTSNVDRLRDLPNFGPYLEAVQESLRQEGIMIDTWREGETEYLFMQNRFGSLEDLSEASPLLGEQPSTWTLAVMETSPLVTEYKFSAVFDVSELLQAGAESDAMTASELNRWLGGGRMTYSLTLPGKITYANASSIEGNRVTWVLEADTPNELVARSQLEHREEVILARLGGVVLAGASVLSLMMLGMAFLVSLRRRDDGKTD